MTDIVIQKLSRAHLAAEEGGGELEAGTVCSRARAVAASPIDTPAAAQLPQSPCWDWQKLPDLVYMGH